MGHDCLKTAGIWYEVMPDTFPRPEKVTLSVKFSLAETSTPYATQFALALKRDPLLKQFDTYNPNAWCKDSCDPDFTTFQHPCRGTLKTCPMSPQQNLTADGKPCQTSCWRVAFRYHQERSKDTGGFMVQ